MIHLITGGSGSGKSAYAEAWLTSHSPLGRKVYLATMKPFGEEGRKKIQRHRELRQGKKFETVECCRNLVQAAIPQNGSILLECVSNLAANTLFRDDGIMEDLQAAYREIIEGICFLAKRTNLLVIVTNEVFEDTDSYTLETEQYRLLLGRVNQELGRMADQITEVVYGIPVPVKR